MKRTFERVPGYDCIANPCGKDGCGTRPGASHGRHCEEWIYVVQDGDVALSLTVFSGAYPNGDTTEPTGTDMTLHVGFPIDRDQIAGRPDAIENIHDCRFVSGGKCYQGGFFSGSLVASEFVKAQFDKSAAPDAQSDGFWIALENRCADWQKDARGRRADTAYAKCVHCDGIGTVRK